MHRHAELGIEQAAQVTLGHTDPRGQLGHARAGHEAFVDQRGGGLRQPAGDPPAHAPAPIPGGNAGKA
jgi:hypothetical protein